MLENELIGSLKVASGVFHFAYWSGGFRWQLKACEGILSFWSCLISGNCQALSISQFFIHTLAKKILNCC